MENHTPDEIGVSTPMTTSSVKTCSDQVSKTGSKKTNSSSSNTIVQLKRLKVEEGVIAKSLRMGRFCMDADSDPGVDDQDSVNSSSNLTEYLSRTKHSVEQIKTLFDDIRSYISTEENIEELDVDDVRKEILDFENKIATFKTNAHVELNTLKQEEEELIQQINEINLAKSEIPKKIQVKSKLFMNEVVSSPVRSIIHSPFKCEEVQKFQEFMKCSKKSYNGWPPYSHNIFVQTWKKYFHSIGEMRSEKHEYQQFVCFDNFKAELIKKLPGLNDQDITSHCDWYIEYLNHKKNLQRALDKWKNNKKLKKVADSYEGVNRHDITSVNNRETLKSTNPEEISERPSKNSKSFELAVGLKSGYKKSTLQWNSKCNSFDDTVIQTIRFEDIGKLGVPQWRQNLHSETK